MSPSTSSQNKKYKLFSAETAGAAGAKPVCAFFKSPAGCRNGDNCKFSHELTSSSPSNGNNKNEQGRSSRKNSVEISETSSVVSSESEGEDGGNGGGRDVKDDTKKIKMELDDDPFGSPIVGKSAQKEQKNDQGQQERKNKKKRKSNNENRDLFPTPKHAAESVGSSGKSDTGPTETPQKKRQKQAPAAKTTASAPAPATSKGGSNFARLLSKLPIASFSIPGSTPEIKKESTTTTSATTTPSKAEAGKAPSTPRSDISKKEKSSKPESIKKPSVTQRVLPTSTEVGKTWKDAVSTTRQHSKFESSYDFSRYKENDKEAGMQSTWIKAKPFGAWCKDNPQAIAIDCEMCESEDPLTGAKNHKALCRLSVVNAEKPDEVLLDTLVKPSWPVTNYRTWINGVTKESLDSVEFTLRHAQAFMMALCSDETVIVGHAVQNDLVALNMEHDVVADSSFLFHAKDSTTATVSLKDTVKSVIGVDMPETHDSVNDARKALECVLHWKDKKGKVELVQRTPKQNPFEKKQRDYSHKLFVHRIPKVCKPEHLSNMFQKSTNIEPSEVEEIVFNGDTGKTYVIFKSSQHANLAFDSLDGKADEDKSGKLQKKVYLRNGDYVRVRKMVHENEKRKSLTSSSSSSNNTPSSP
mmetsp:Transcript_46833/g.114208  ORF Transcript_46833/g.114208 Transcript_46833/m.114208 type:complete len:640 (-) Transcript_46833:123-2042(-)